MAEEARDGPLKIFLWITGRSVSTSFLKCMTYVPDTVAWFEPYLQVEKFSCKGTDPLLAQTYQDILAKYGGESEVNKIQSGYDASDKDLDWLKEQLEGDFPGKKMVFVKEHGTSVHRDKIPNGFRHTFLVRNPYKIMSSFLKHAIKREGSNTVNKSTPGTLHPIQDLNELWKFVKAEGLESRPVILDADDLLENPKEMLEAYCNEVGIPFTEDLLTWPAGDDVMTNIWMVPKQTILTFRAENMHETTFASTGFVKKPSPTCDDSLSAKDELMNLMKEIPTDVSELASMFHTVAEREIPYYEELYAERLTPKK